MLTEWFLRVSRLKERKIIFPWFITDSSIKIRKNKSKSHYEEYVNGKKKNLRAEQHYLPNEDIAIIVLHGNLIEKMK